MDVELFRFTGSNACVTVECLLDHNGIPWRAHEVRPIQHVFVLRRHRFPGRTVPAAFIDGERVQGSRAICSAIAERRPELGLLPADPALRERVLAADEAGERLQNALRRVFYVLAQRDRSVVRPIIDASFTRTPELGKRAIARILVPLASKGHAAKASRIDGYVDRVAALLTEFDELVEEGILGTDTPTVADFQVGPNITALAADPRARQLLEARPCWRIAERTCPVYPIDINIEMPLKWVQRLEPTSR